MSYPIDDWCNLCGKIDDDSLKSFEKRGFVFSQALLNVKFYVIFYVIIEYSIIISTDIGRFNR